jgi:myo-inositol-1(or 4)-monophosphatase
MGYENELKLARDIALKAGRLQLDGRGSLGNVDRKSDDSPVTEVDRKCEALIRDSLLKSFPADGFLGEETGQHKGTSGRTWIVDPLDGTRPYIRGIPTYSVLIALEDADEPVVGVLHLPALGETYWAHKGGQAFFNGNPIHVSTTPELSRALASSLGFVERADTPEAASLMKLMRNWDYAYGFMDVYSYACVAAGRLDLCVNLLDKPWDCAAAACVVKAAGGRYSDISGNENIHNGTIVLSNGILHDAVLTYFHDVGPR